MSWYKRFGYKQPSGGGGGAYDRFTLFRFTLVVFAFLSILLSGIYSGDYKAKLYLVSVMGYVILSFIPEFFPKVKNLFVCTLSILLIAFTIHSKEGLYGHITATLFDNYGFYYFWSITNMNSYLMFIMFNILIFIVSFFLISPFKK